MPLQARAQSFWNNKASSCAWPSMKLGSFIPTTLLPGGWGQQPWLDHGQWPHFTASVVLLGLELKTAGQDCCLRRDSINRRTYPQPSLVYHTTASPASAKSGPEALQVQSLQASVLLESLREPRLRMPSLSYSMVQPLSASLHCHILTSLASLIMVTSAIYLQKLHKLSSLGQWNVQPSLFSLEMNGFQTALGISEMCSIWNSGLSHWETPNLTNSFWDWLFQAISLTIKGREICLTARARALMI